MPKQKTKFICSECGYETGTWLGKCPACLKWNTFEEEVETEKRGTLSAGNVPKAIRDRSFKDSEERVKPASGVDRVSAAGLGRSLCLWEAIPESENPLFLLQVCETLSPRRKFFTIGEESVNQIKIRPTGFGEPPYPDGFGNELSKT